MGKDFSKVADSVCEHWRHTSLTLEEALAAALAKARADAIEEAAKVVDGILAEAVAQVSDEHSSDLTRLIAATHGTALEQAVNAIRSLAQPTNTKETPDV